MNTRSLAAALLLAALAGPAPAEPLPPAARDQAARCVAAVRAVIRDDMTVRLRHVITSVRTIGARRAFDIESSAWASAGAPRPFVSRCFAERWGDGVELAWVRPAPPAGYSAGVRR
jgi:hypothetical protein